MIWTWSKNFSVLVAYQKRLCVGDLYFHKCCFVRCNLSGDTGNKSPLALQECNPVFPLFKHKSLLYYLYYALDASGFLEKSTFLSTWQAYSACIDNIGSRAQGNMLIFSVSCCSFMLVRSTHVCHSLLLWSQIFRLKIV